MSDGKDWNTSIIEEFRANEGRVGGQFAGAPMLLLHHRGRQSGRGMVGPGLFKAGENDPPTG
ncbi:nitroreductase/quinone reductase family protein [Nocardia farcinica]|uniref:nitroreductase/quinone reductase family protein n=1 Tax=Nocardia farcinica TaxID=37329 RepID=UPI0024565736|nr:nitroreductase/quinone reductase family protein [Nocardia farcinica]